MKLSVPTAASRGQQKGAVRYRWPLLALSLCVVYIVLEVYGPALSGPFLYDDMTLPFLRPELASRPFWGWMINVRPLLMLSYWGNYQLGATDPLGYHLLNLGFHLGATACLFLALRKLLLARPIEAPAATALAALCGAVFLLHPIQTEAVAYVASRSEALSVFFFLAALTLFLYTRRPEGISWGATLGVLTLAACAVTTKEHTAVLPALLLLTERYWYAASWREAFLRYRRLWIPFLILGTIAGVFIASVLSRSTSAGFGLSGIRWYEYFFTQCRALFVYIRLFLLPVDQNFDPDFPISHNLLDQGAWLGLACLLLAAWAAWRYRQQYPLASYGFFVFLLLIAPTSSVIPIKDVVAERRLYLPMLGLLLIALEWLVRWRKERAILAVSLTAVLIGYSIASYNRNVMWGKPLLLWKDTIAKSPDKLRLYEHLGHAYVTAHRCQDAVDLFSNLSQRSPRLPSELLVHWAGALDCVHQPERALVKLYQASTLSPDAATFHNIGSIQFRLGHAKEAREALERAVALKAPWDATYTMLGDLLKRDGDLGPAVQQYRQAIVLNPHNEYAQQQLIALQTPQKSNMTSVGYSAN